ncbi:MAG TPA: hypothetical protein VI636_18575, partial [Candidatus Angelobacter sp.]
MIRYIAAEDDSELASIIVDCLKDHIKHHVGPVDLKNFAICGGVQDVQEKIKHIGSELQLLVLDLDFHGNVLTGFRILDNLTECQRRVVVVYSAHLKEPSPRVGKTGSCLEDLMGG